MEVDEFSSALIPRDIPLDRHTNSPWKPSKQEEMETVFSTRCPSCKRVCTWTVLRKLHATLAMVKHGYFHVLVTCESACQAVNAARLVKSQTENHTSNTVLQKVYELIIEFSRNSLFSMIFSWWIKCCNFAMSQYSRRRATAQLACAKKTH